MNYILKVKRGYKIGSTYIPRQFELVWSLDTRELIVGDGKTMVKDLNGVSNVVAAPNGRLYSVEVDNFGVAKTTPLMMYRNGLRKIYKHELYAY